MPLDVHARGVREEPIQRPLVPAAKGEGQAVGEAVAALVNILDLLRAISLSQSHLFRAVSALRTAVAKVAQLGSRSARLSRECIASGTAQRTRRKPLLRGLCNSPSAAGTTRWRWLRSIANSSRAAVSRSAPRSIPSAAGVR